MAIPDQLFKLCFLQTLDVSRNKLQKVPALLGDLKELRVLDLSHNQITTFELSQVSACIVSLTQSKHVGLCICMCPAVVCMCLQNIAHGQLLTRVGSAHGQILYRWVLRTNRM